MRTVSYKIQAKEEKKNKFLLPHGINKALILNIFEWDFLCVLLIVQKKTPPIISTQSKKKLRKWKWKLRENQLWVNHNGNEKL